MAREEHAANASVITQRLSSRDPLDAAWGAYLAGEEGSNAAQDTLLGLLQDEPLARDAALDALARMGAHVPDTILRSAMAYDEMTAIAIALQEPAEHRDLIYNAFADRIETLPAFIEDHDEALAEWRAYANALAWLRDPEFAATLLGSLDASISLTVVSVGHDGMGLGCRCSAHMRGHSSCWGGYAFNALPPIGSWSIRDASDAKCVVLLPGPIDVCLARSTRHVEPTMLERALSGEPLRAWVSSIGHDRALAIVDDYGIVEETPAHEEAEEVFDEESFDDEAADAIDPAVRGACAPGAVAMETETESVASELNDELFGYLSAVADRSVGFDAKLSVHTAWTSDDAYRELVTGLRDGIRAKHTAIAASLSDDYILPAGYRPRPLHVRVDADDMRSCGVTGPLPRF